MFSKTSEHYLKIMKDINELISKEIGGTLEWVEYKNIDLIKLRWTNFTGDGRKVYLEIIMSYTEFDQLTDPALMAKRFIDLYKEKKAEKYG